MHMFFNPLQNIIIIKHNQFYPNWKSNVNLQGTYKSLYNGTINLQKETNMNLQLTN